MTTAAELLTADRDAMADLIVRTIRTRGRQVDVTAESAIRDALRAFVPTIIRKERERTRASERLRNIGYELTEQGYQRGEHVSAAADLIDELSAALEQAEKWFWDYGEGHAKKGDRDKAQRNWDRAAACRAALAAARGETPR